MMLNPKFVKVFTKIRLKIYFNVKNVKKSLNFGNYFCFFGFLRKFAKYYYERKNIIQRNRNVFKYWF